MRSTEIIRFFFYLLISSMSVTVVCQFYILYQKNYQPATYGSSRQLKGIGHSVRETQDGESLERLFHIDKEDGHTDDKGRGTSTHGQMANDYGKDERKAEALKSQGRNLSEVLRDRNGEIIAKEFYANFAKKLETVEKVLAVIPTPSKKQRIDKYAEAYKKYNISSRKGTVLAKSKRGETKVLVTLPYVVPTNASDLGPMLDFGIDDLEETDESGEMFPSYKRLARPKRPSRDKKKKIDDIKIPGILNSTTWKSYIDLHEYKYILNPKDKCLTDDGVFKRISLLMLVASAPKNFDRRDLIRRTWGMATRSTAMHMETVFLIGAVADRQVTMDLSRELVNYGDIVQEDFVDSYLNLTIKTVMGLKWASRYCQNAKFVMKTDDDMAVNTMKMLVHLRTAPSRNFVTGKAAFGFDIIRDVYSKFYVPYSVTNDDKYPPYCIGIGYVISMDVVHKAYIAAMQTPLFPWEDVFFGLCLRRIGVTPTNIKGFMGGGFFDDKKGGALKTDHTSLNRLRSSYVIHDITAKQMEMVWGQWAGLSQP